MQYHLVWPGWAQRRNMFQRMQTQQKAPESGTARASFLKLTELSVHIPLVEVKLRKATVFPAVGKLIP